MSILDQYGSRINPDGTVSLTGNNSATSNSTLNTTGFLGFGNNTSSGSSVNPVPYTYNSSNSSGNYVYTGGYPTGGVAQSGMGAATLGVDSSTASDAAKAAVVAANNPATAASTASAMNSGPLTITKPNMNIDPNTLDNVKAPDTKPIEKPSNAVDDNAWYGAKGLAAIGQIGQAVGGIWNAFNGYKNYKLAKKQFEFQKALAHANFQQQAQTYNNANTSAGNGLAALAGAGLAGLNYSGTPTAGEVAANQAAVKAHNLKEDF